MGTGKTETGRVLAEMLGCDFVDTDRLIERREGMQVAEIFARRGEPHFRARERKVCAELSGREDLVVATGGGTLVDAGNLAQLSRRGRVILLDASVEAILRRTRADRTRPLLTGAAASDSARADRIRAILQSRAVAYGKITDRIDTSRSSPQDVAARIAAGLAIPPRVLTLHLADRVTKIETGRGLLSALGARLKAHRLGRRIFLLLPKAIRDLFLAQIAASLDHHDLPWEIIEIRDGDAEKNLAQAQEVIDALATRGAARDATVVAVGGGVTGDLAGFVASIYMRGIALVHVPTTLLAQVDSSIGGKVGVNHPHAKNLIGRFHQPRLVLCDPCVLRTLPDREVAGGMAEVIKTAIIGAPQLFDYLEQELRSDPAEKVPEPALRNPALLERCVAECAAVKSAIVQRDPFERDERRVLNLGHTLGHALESVAGYALTHGEAVAIGLAAALRIAVRRGVTSADFLERTCRLLERCGLPVDSPPVDEETFLASLHLDKKKRDGRFHFVLPLGPGSVRIVDDVSGQEMLDAIRKGEQ